jgi:hypothetical protein
MVPVQDFKCHSNVNPEITSVSIVLFVNGRKRFSDAHLRERSGRLILLLPGLPPDFVERTPLYP